ncbi:hypothetical protein ASPWEDRAFT_227467 [Aspergillus wentii DTO 134E9]|uniref:Uncharacterized protein n=1 Tax=Aspergillus wentii DTO 134E9 TaxID=1073089 RepID=A0A1L9S0I9_ASPWE|nr:uncharacterized protein ASPWEDRAFT_227467 [Aspergillus wentii DTO 134E9]OJJ40672.1 hypothetical protein ASPWEDRAFT_227467 [Aspergillus wentii DTO 134E9]
MNRVPVQKGLSSTSIDSDTGIAGTEMRCSSSPFLAELLRRKKSSVEAVDALGPLRSSRLGSSAPSYLIKLHFWVRRRDFLFGLDTSSSRLRRTRNCRGEMVCLGHHHFLESLEEESSDTKSNVSVLGYARTLCRILTHQQQASIFHSYIQSTHSVGQSWSMQLLSLGRTFYQQVIQTTPFGISMQLLLFWPFTCSG